MDGSSIYMVHIHCMYTFYKYHCRATNVLNVENWDWYKYMYMYMYVQGVRVCQSRHTVMVSFSFEIGSTVNLH